MEFPLTHKFKNSSSKLYRSVNHKRHHCLMDISCGKWDKKDFSVVNKSVRLKDVKKILRDISKNGKTLSKLSLGNFL